MPYFPLPFLTPELHFESPGGIFGGPKVFSSRKSREFSAAGNFAVYTFLQAVTMEQLSAEDRPTDIFHTFPAMPTFSYAEQQFLKWVVMFQCKLAIPSVQYFFLLSIF